MSRDLSSDVEPCCAAVLVVLIVGALWPGIAASKIVTAKNCSHDHSGADQHSNANYGRHENFLL